MDESKRVESVDETLNDIENIPNHDQTAAENKAEPAGKHLESKNKKISVKMIVLIVLSVIVIAAAAIGVSCYMDYAGGGKPSDKPIVIEIKQGMTVNQIADELKNHGVINQPFTYKVYLKLSNADHNFSYGFYAFDGTESFKEITEILSSHIQRLPSVTVTIPEGSGINDFVKNVNGSKVTVPGIASILEKNGVCTKADFLKAIEQKAKDYDFLPDSDDVYYQMEGYLFPETYDFYCYDSKKCAVLAVEKMIAEGQKRFTDEMKAKAEKQGYSVNEILTMASIIQLEAGNKIDGMPGVAGVFYNRLHDWQGGKLGSSPTGFYGKSFKYDDGRYDTYDIQGLPPGPLCAPGDAAINAALNPQAHSYYYFVTDKDSKFYFHKTFDEQQRTIAKLKKENKWVYESYD